MDFSLRAPIDPSLSIIEQIFENREFPFDKIQHYVHVTDEDILSLDTIDNLLMGTQMLLKHIVNNDKIYVQVDSDCDGYTSAAVLINYLNKLVPHFTQTNVFYGLHKAKKHGIIIEAIPEDTKLVIAPDSSSNEYDIHKLLNERGCDVLVIDHHEAEKVSENACVINNQLCAYPNKDLSGVGMVYKFCCFIDQYLDKDYADDFLDLVALGLVGDMMDLRSFETHRLIEKGIEKIKNPFFKEMTIKQNFQLKDGITPFKLSFYVVPFINAITRVGSSDEKLLVFESMLEYRAYELIPSTKRGCAGQMETRVEQAVRTCNNVKNHQQKDRDKGAEYIESLINEQALLNHKILLILIDDSKLNPNLRGLVANELSAKYHHPTLILAKRKEDDGEEVWSGSGRGLTHSQLTDFREFLLSTGLVKWATGHANAFGCAIRVKDIDQFIQLTDSMLENFDFSTSYKVDFILDANIDYIEKVVSEIADYKQFWGQGLEEPLIAIKNVKLTDANTTYLTSGKRPTLKISDGQLNYIKFGVPEDEYEAVKYSTINIIGTCENNVWNGMVNPQVLIEDYEICSIPKKAKYYF